MPEKDTCICSPITTPLEMARAMKQSVNNVIADLDTINGMAKAFERSENTLMVADNLNQRIFDNLCALKAATDELLDDSFHLTP